MDIFSFFSLFGGLAFFLYGMHVMSSGLEKMSGGKMEKILKSTTSNKPAALALGAGITIAIQSSSAMTVILVGLVNSGLMVLSDTVTVIMGSNIGTTLTAWILSVSGIQSDNIFLNLLKPENFAPLFAFIGICMTMLSKKQRRHDIGNILLGFAVLMYGMTLMSNSMAPLTDSDEFTSILLRFRSFPLAPLIGVVVGAVFTGIIQSSAASIGILQALSLTGGISYGLAIPIIMGQNIGTCATALISSIGVSKNAKRVSIIHVLIKIIGTIFFLLIFYIPDLFLNFDFLDNTIGPVGIAAVHSIFNIVNTLLLLPFEKQLVKLSTVIIPDKEDLSSDDKYVFLDERLLSTPSFAISECFSHMVKMAQTAQETLTEVMWLLFNKYDEKKVEDILKKEDLLDMYEDKLGSFLVKISSKEISDKDSHEISKMLHSIGDFERLGDHAVNLLSSVNEMHEKGLQFTEDAEKELLTLTNALQEILSLTCASFIANDVVTASSVEPLEQVIDDLVNIVKTNHVERLQSGKCTIEMGFVLSDILNNYERISDHCSNIAVTVIEVEQGTYDTHEYLNNVKNMSDENFNKEFSRFAQKYSIH